MASHTGKFGLEVQIHRAFDKNFHAQVRGDGAHLSPPRIEGCRSPQFSLPHFVPQMRRSAYQLRRSSLSDVHGRVCFTSRYAAYIVSGEIS